MQYFKSKKNKFTSHLCTFMGRESNVCILIQYIEAALAIDAVDNYWMIDMTRCVSDHEYIMKEQQRLHSIYPGRVHIYNYDTRDIELKDQAAIKAGVGSWSTFYKFLSRFSNNDVIAKCDDDTLYFDIECIEAAFKLRWDNKQPYIMHANTINNGVTAYHQNKAGIWSNDDLDVYPAGGLTGPLFSEPEIACGHHKRFTQDLIQSKDNINKYKLNSNIYFQNRVSINFIFMLGTDKDTLTTIDLQDEYEVSSKKPQSQDRPNMIIGDFICAHHTYGVQEPVMDREGTYGNYMQLVKSLEPQFREMRNKDIFSSINRVTSLKSSGAYIAKHPANKHTHKIQHQSSGRYISCDWSVEERVNINANREKVPTGDFWARTEITSTKDINQACLFDIDTSKECNLAITNSSRIFKAGGTGRISKTFFPGHLIAKFFQGGYKRELIRCVDAPGGYMIESAGMPGYFMNMLINKKKDKINIRFTQGKGDIFNLISQEANSQELVSIIIHRGDNTVLNDTTYYTLNSTGEDIRKPREWYWMVDHFLWELIPHQDTTVNIRLICDDQPELYLSVCQGNIVMSHDPYDFEIHDNMIQDPVTCKFIQLDDMEVTMGDKGTSLIR